jgi:hypothetical protein
MSIQRISIRGSWALGIVRRWGRGLLAVKGIVGQTDIQVQERGRRDFNGFPSGNISTYMWIVYGDAFVLAFPSVFHRYF